jgi:hypothetical protein
MAQRKAQVSDGDFGPNDRPTQARLWDLFVRRGASTSFFNGFDHLFDDLWV